MSLPKPMLFSVIVRLKGLHKRVMTHEGSESKSFINKLAKKKKKKKILYKYTQASIFSRTQHNIQTKHYSTSKFKQIVHLGIFTNTFYFYFFIIKQTLLKTWNLNLKPRHPNTICKHNASITPRVLNNQTTLQIIKKIQLTM
jgi:hypothetical protein